MKPTRKVNRVITKADKKMAKRANIIIENISYDVLKTHEVYGKLIQKLVGAGVDEEILELHCSDNIGDILWLGEDFCLIPNIGLNIDLNKVESYGITVNVNLDEEEIKSFLDLLSSIEVYHGITHTLSFDKEGTPTIEYVQDKIFH